jgi:hypothetical protein
LLVGRERFGQDALVEEGQTIERRSRAWHWNAACFAGVASVLFAIARAYYFVADGSADDDPDKADMVTAGRVLTSAAAIAIVVAALSAWRSIEARCDLRACGGVGARRS